MYVAWRSLVVDGDNVLSWQYDEQYIQVSWPEWTIPLGANWNGQIVIAPKGGGSSGG
jgi:hypothetical protein